jgi:hypothetical protein
MVSMGMAKLTPDEIPDPAKKKIWQGNVQYIFCTISSTPGSMRLESISEISALV